MVVRFVAVGELLVDVVTDGSGHDARIRVQPGGSAFNAAVTAAAAGAEATVIGTVGDDPAGHMILGELDAHRIEARVTVAAGRTGAFVLTSGVVRVDKGTAHTIALPDTIEGDAVLVSGYLPADTIAAGLARARAPWVALDAARLDSLPPGGNVVFANEEAARRLTGKGPEDAAHELGERYRLVCVTRGKLGTVAAFDGEITSAVPTEPVDCDLPGAGDAFAAALLVALAGDTSFPAALAEACRWGARAVAIGSAV